MTTFTKERLLKIQQWRETYGAGSNVVLPTEEAEELARIALASLEAPSLPDETVDHRDAFEAVFPIPLHAERCGTGYCCTAYNAWEAQKFVNRWEGWNACRAAMQGKAESQKVQPYKLPDGYCVMPLRLTAENGAKGALSGEFHVTLQNTSQSCGGEGCEDCNEEGSWESEIPIGWDTIKRIHEVAVEACALPAAPQQEV